MKIYNPLLIKTGSQEMIQYWESPEPKRSVLHPEFDYLEMLEKWEKEVKTLDVHPSAVEEIKAELYILLNPKYSYELFEIDIETNGISISGIEDRLYIDGGYFKLKPDNTELNTIKLNTGDIYSRGEPIPSAEEETPQTWDEILSRKNFNHQDLAGYESYSDFLIYYLTKNYLPPTRINN